MNKKYYTRLLHQASLKATPARLTVLSVLNKFTKPLSAENIHKLAKEREFDKATAYRSLDALTRIGLVKQVNLQRDKTYYELSDRKSDHHHLICLNCGVVEDFEGCNSDEIIRKALKSSRQFSRIKQHSLELFGMCIKCEKSPDMKGALIIILFALSISLSAQAQNQIPDPIEGAVDDPTDTYYKAQVVEVADQQTFGSGSEEQLFQDLKVKILSGDEKDNEILITGVGGLSVNGGKGFKAGDKVIVNKTLANGQTSYFVTDIYRIPALITISLIFLIVVLIFSKWRGITSLLGLAISIGVIIKYAAPQILAGKNPLTVTLISAFVIALVSIYLAHGFNQRTSVAVFSTLLTLGLSVGIAFFSSISQIFSATEQKNQFICNSGKPAILTLEDFF